MLTHFPLQLPQQVHQQSLYLVDSGHTVGQAAVQLLFKIWHSFHHKQMQTAFGQPRKLNDSCRVPTFLRFPVHLRLAQPLAVTRKRPSRSQPLLQQAARPSQAIQ
jgi:hypothetical protein